MNKDRPLPETPERFPKRDTSSTPSPFMVAPGSTVASTPSSPFSATTPAAESSATPAPAAAAAASSTPAATFQPAATPAPAAAPASAANESPVGDNSPFIVDEVTSSSSQTALRAIFGVDHEMNVEEILQRLRSLPGIRHIALVTGSDVSLIDGLKKSLSVLGFGTANVRIYGGNVPMEFVRHGNILLAVQTLSGFGPGVKEAIKLAAHEIQLLS